MSVMTEVVSDHPWSTAMNDPARARQPDQHPFDPHYRPPSPRPSSRRTASQSSRRSPSSASSTAAPRSSHAAQPSPASHIHSRSGSSHLSSSASTLVPTPQDQPPSPRLPLSGAAAGLASPAPSTTSSGPDPLPSSQQHAGKAAPRRMKVDSLQCIRDMAANRVGSIADTFEGDSDAAPPQYDISGMNPMEILEMVAGLLTKITTTNDEHYDYLHRAIPPPDAAASLSPQTTSVWAFHGKNVPSITILSYLGRIQKYCPATYEVFLSLLVYFDRMTERVNTGQMQSLRQANEESLQRMRSKSESSDSSRPQSDATPPFPGSMSPRNERHPPVAPPLQEPPSPPLSDSDPTNLSSFFVVDSFNIHRLVIAGVTCAAKFFSDVFFTNSRYAKVGGLPLVELNHLELQFLLLNDFRLQIPVEELEQYGTMLVEFYAREIVAQGHAEGSEAHVAGR